jgi:sulfhydrogenase subunit delta
MAVPRIAVFSFTSCEGCQLQILNLEDELLALLRRVEIVNFREAMTERSDDYQIALVEGSVSTQADEDELREVRARAAVLVTIGACAVTTGVNGMRNALPAEQAWARVYPDRGFDAGVQPRVRRVADVVKVDVEVPGCPIDRGELLRTLTVLLLGQVPRLPSTPVCDECRRAGNPCLLDRGEFCFGSVTRSGCGAICPRFGESCCACRGLLPAAPLAELLEILELRGIPRAESLLRLTQFASQDPQVLALTAAPEPVGVPI